MILTHITLFNFIPGATLGGTPPPTPSGDTHDGGRWRYEEIEDDAPQKLRALREDRERLTTELRAAVAKVTGKPPSLDASPKELAAIARKSEAIDYRAVVAEVERIQREESAIAAAREARAQRERARRMMEQEDDFLLMLFH